EIKSVERVTSRIADSVRNATYGSDTARRFTSKAQDALGDGMYETKRALKLFKRRVGSLEQSARSYVKRDPLKSAVVIAGVAELVGCDGGRRLPGGPRGGRGEPSKPRGVFGRGVLVGPDNRLHGPGGAAGRDRNPRHDPQPGGERAGLIGQPAHHRRTDEPAR